jgi:hypothetical protein
VSAVLFAREQQRGGDEDEGDGRFVDGVGGGGSVVGVAAGAGTEGTPEQSEGEQVGPPHSGRLPDLSSHPE